jgi:serine protease AprX
LDDYFRISGTSASAAVTSGAAALLLQDEPNLTPDQVKYRLISTAVKGDRWPGYDPVKAGAGYLDIYAAVHATTTEAANTQQPISQQLWTEEDWANYGSVNWGTVNWGTVNWGTVNWGTVNWGTVNWGTVNWGAVNYSSDNWNEQ